MLTKILITALVIFGCYLFLRYSRRPAPDTRREPARPAVNGTAFRRLAAGVLLLSLLAAVAAFLYGWYDDRTLLDIRVINTLTGDVVHYQAYKGDLEGRSFVTLYGQQVSIADSERLEVSPAP